MVSFLLEEGADAQEESFSSQNDVRKDETIQTTIVKIIERAEAKTVIEITSVEKIN